MSQDTENFDSLRRLLAIKRHETPPPGYYHTFSQEVIVRIKAGERGEDAHGYVWQLGWLQRLWSAFEARPALAGALGLAVCSLVVFGVVSADNAPLPSLPNMAEAQDGMQPTGMRVANNDTGDSSLVIRPGSTSAGDTATLFSLIPNAQAAPASSPVSLMAPQ